MKILSFLSVLLMLGLISETKAQCISGDCQNGYGKKKYSNGTYEGDFQGGKRNGSGTYNFDNGDKYVGDWKNDLRHGYGDYTYKDGAVKSGKWVDGKCTECFTDKPKSNSYKPKNNNSGPPKQPKPVGTNPTVTPGRY